jgi:glutamate 5-kinase
MRVVVKIGTNLVTGERTLDVSKVKNLASELAKLKKAGHELVVVTSGAIGAGMGKLGRSSRPDTLRAKQALAAIGQPILMDAYQQSFTALGYTVAQVLLTRQDFIDRERYLNARNTINELLSLGIIPVINENDTVAVEEISFGDNDTLAALVSSKISADLLFLLTDVDGLYKGIPRKSELINTVEDVTPELEDAAKESSGSGKGVGGMRSKILAGQVAIRSGVKMVILNGTKNGVIERYLKDGGIGTTFLPKKTLDSRKCWIAFGTKCSGNIVIDDGAADALLKNGKSLLASGIVSVEGDFGIGDTVSVTIHGGKEVARGLTFYSSEDIKKIKGKKTQEIKKILASADYEEVIHRDNLVIL